MVYQEIIPKYSRLTIGFILNKISQLIWIFVPTLYNLNKLRVANAILKQQHFFFI